MQQLFRYLLIPHQGSLEMTAEGQFRSVMLGDIEALVAGYALPNLTSVTRPDGRGFRKFMCPPAVIRASDQYVLIRLRESNLQQFIKPLIAEKAALLTTPIYVYAMPALSFEMVTFPGWYRLPTASHRQFVRASELTIPAEWQTPAGVFPLPRLPFTPTRATLTLSISTYGRERIDAQGRMVSALKCGVRNGLTALKVLGDRAQNVSSKRHRYLYLKVEEAADVQVKSDFLLIDLPVTQLETVEYHLLGDSLGADVVVWGHDQWYELPNATTGDYRPAIHHYPRFAGEGLFHSTPASVASTTENSTATLNPAGCPVRIEGNGMVMSWRKGYEDKSACWWMEDRQRTSKQQSQTYRHRDTIRSVGAKWSSTFQAWYYSRPQPPQAWLQLVGYQTEATSVTQSQDDVKEDILAFPAAAIVALLESDEIAAGRHYNLPLAFLREQQARYPNKGSDNPIIWAKLYSVEQTWMFLVSDYTEAVQQVFGHLIHLRQNERGEEVIHSREWVWKALDELEEAHVQRTPNFTADNFNNQLYLIEQRCTPAELTLTEQAWKARLQEDQQQRQQFLERLKLPDDALIYPLYPLKSDQDIEQVEVTSTYRFSRFNRETDGLIFYRVVGENTIQRRPARDFIRAVAAVSGDPQHPAGNYHPFTARLEAEAKRITETTQALEKYERLKGLAVFSRDFTERLHTLTATGVRQLPAHIITLDDPWS